MTAGGLLKDFDSLMTDNRWLAAGHRSELPELKRIAPSIAKIICFFIVTIP